MTLKKLYSWPKKLYQFIANLFLLVNIWNSGWVWYHLQKNLISSCLPSWLTCIMLQKRWNVLLVACCSLVFACCSLLFACCLSTSAHCSLLFAHCSILSAHCWILFAHCLLLSACCWLLFARCSRRNSEGFFLVKVKKNVLHIKSHCLQESGKIGTFVYWVTQIFFIFRYNVAFARETKTFFLDTSTGNMATKNISQIWNHDNFLNFRRQYLIMPNRSHVFVMVCVLWSVLKK